MSRRVLFQRFRWAAALSLACGPPLGAQLAGETVKLDLRWRQKQVRLVHADRRPCGVLPSRSGAPSMVESRPIASRFGFLAASVFFTIEPPDPRFEVRVRSSPDKKQWGEWQTAAAGSGGKTSAAVKASGRAGYLQFQGEWKEGPGERGCLREIGFVFLTADGLPPPGPPR